MTKILLDDYYKVLFSQIKFALIFVIFGLIASIILGLNSSKLIFSSFFIGFFVYSLYFGKTAWGGRGWRLRVITGNTAKILAFLYLAMAIFILIEW